MECPRCKLINPPGAMRCDCGYDFTSKTVEASYVPQALPKVIKNSLVIIVVLNVILAVAVLLTGNVGRLAVALLWTMAVWVLYFRLVKHSNSARIALAVLTFPIGTAFFLAPNTKLYCFQNGDT